MRDEKINIWPHSLLYVIFVLGISGGFTFIVLTIGPILVVVFEDEPLRIFGLSLNNAWSLVLTIPGSILFNFMFFKAILWKVSFTETDMIAPKIAEVQEKNVHIECKQILTCETTMVGFYYYFTFHCADGKKRKIFITRFSFKQMEKILKLIQDRGGLQGENIDEIINPLRIKKKNKHRKRNDN